eukprot:331053-Rhodomonas_salina.7
MLQAATFSDEVCLKSPSACTSPTVSACALFRRTVFLGLGTAGFLVTFRSTISCPCPRPPRSETTATPGQVGARSVRTIQVERKSTSLAVGVHTQRNRATMTRLKSVIDEDRFGGRQVRCRNMHRSSPHYRQRCAMDPQFPKFDLLYCDS